MDFNSLIAELRASSENLPKDSADRSLLSSVYCNKACKVLDDVAESTDYDTIITGLWLVTAHFAEQLAYLKPVPALSELCFKLFRQCAKAVLNIQWQNLEEDSSLRQNFLASLANLHAKLLPFDFPRFRLLEGLTENPWTNPTLAKVMGGEVEDGDKEEVRAYIEQEDPIILQLRVDMMLQENCEEYALNLCNNCLSHPELQSDLGVRKTQLSLLYKLGQEDKLQEECQKLNIQDAVRIIKQLQTSETHRQICTVLAQTFMVQNWIRPSDMEANKELLRLWIRHQLLVDREHDQFKESVWAMAKLSQSTEQIVIFIDVLREECGEIFLQLYVDMCIFAINVDKGQMETNKKEGNMEAAAARRSDMASICAKLSCLCHHASVKVARICALTSFALKPTEQSFVKIGTFYGQGTDCCNKCGRDRNREPGTINPATLYEVERLLNMLRPDYLSPDQSYTNIQILCRRFLQESLKNAQQLQRQQMIAQNSGINTLIGGPKITAAASRPTNVFEALSPQDYHNTQMLLNRMRIQSITHTKASIPGSPAAQHRYKAGCSGEVEPGELASPSLAGQANKPQYMFDVEKIKSKQPYGVPVEQQHQYYLMKHEKELEQRRKNAQKKREEKTQQGMTSNPQIQQRMWQQQQNPKAQHSEQVNEMIQTALQDSSALQKLTQSANPGIVQAVINMMKGSVVKAAASSDLQQQTGSQQMKSMVSSPQQGTQPLPTVSTLLKPSVQAHKQQNQEHVHAKQQQSLPRREQSPPRRHPRPQLYAQPIVVSTASSVAPQRYQPSNTSVTSMVNRNSSSVASAGEKQKGEGFVLAKSHVEDIRRFMQMQMSNLQQKQIAEPRQMSGSTVTLKNTSIANTSFSFTNRPKTTVELAEQAALAKLQKHDSSKPGMLQQSQQLASNSGQMFMSQSKQALPKPGQRPQFTPSMNRMDDIHHQPPPQHQQKLLQSHHQQVNSFCFQNSPTSNMNPNQVLPSDELSGSIMGIDDTIIKELLQDSGILANTFPDIEVETIGEDKSKYSSLPQSAMPPIPTQMSKSSNSQLYNYMNPPVSQTPYTAQGLPASRQSAQANSFPASQPHKTASASQQSSPRAVNKYSLLPSVPCSGTVSHSPLNPSISRLGERASGCHPSWADMKSNAYANPKENTSFFYNRKEIKDEIKPTVDQLREIMKKEDIEGEVCMDAANNATYRCIICSIAFESLDHLREHVRNVCKPGLQSSSVYNTKIKQDRANSAKAGVETTTVFQCLRCFELCVSDAGIKQHRLTCKRVPTVPSDLKKDNVNNKQRVMSKSPISKLPPKKVPKDHADMMPELPLPFPYPSLNAEAVFKNTPQGGSLISQTLDSSIDSRWQTQEPSNNHLINKSTIATSTPLPNILSNTSAVVAAPSLVSSSMTSCLTATSQPQPSSLSVNIGRQTPICSRNITTSDTSMEDTLVLPSYPAVPAEIVTNSASVVQRELETKEIKPVVKENPEAIPQPSFTEITGSGGSKFYKCGLCSQTLCSHESFLVHWKECAVKNKNLIKKLELKGKACGAKPISGEVLENLIRVIADVAAGSGSIPECISLDSEFSDVGDYYGLRDPCKAGLLDMGESSGYLDSDFWYDSADSNYQEDMSEDGVETGETGDGSVTGSGFTDTMDVSKDGENECEKDTDEGIKEEGDDEYTQGNRKHLEETDDGRGEGESERSYVSTRKAPPKLRDRKTLKPIHSFINETFNSPFSKTPVKPTSARSDEKLIDETEESREKQSSESEVESDGDSLYCKVCRTSFQTKRILLQHFAGKHLQPYTVKTVADSSSYFCHLCQKTYSTFMHYMQHVPNHSVTIYEKMKAFIASRKSQPSQRIALQRGLDKKEGLNQKMAKALKNKKAGSKSAVDRLEQQLLAGKTQAMRERMKISKRKRSLQSAFTSSEDDFSSDASNNVVFKSKKSESENREPTARPKRSTSQLHQTGNTNSLESFEQSEEEESDGQGPRLARDLDDDYVLSEEIDSDSMDSSIAPPTTRSRNRNTLHPGFDSKTVSSELNEGVFDQDENNGLKCLPDTILADYDADSNCSDLLLSQCQNGHFVPTESQLDTQGRSHEASSIAEDTGAVESGKEFIPGRTLIVRSLNRRLKERLKSCDLHPTVVLKPLQLDIAIPHKQEVSSPMGAVSQHAHSSSNKNCEEEPAHSGEPAHSDESAHSGEPTQNEASTSAAVKAQNSSFLDSFLSYLNQYPSHTETVQVGRKRCRSGPPRVRGFRKRRRSIDLSHLRETDEEGQTNLRHSSSLKLDASQNMSESEASIHVQSFGSLQGAVQSTVSKFPTRQCSVYLGQKLSLEELRANRDLLSGARGVAQDKLTVSVTALASHKGSTEVMKSTDSSSSSSSLSPQGKPVSVVILEPVEKIGVSATKSNVPTNEKICVSVTHKPVKQKKQSGGSATGDTDTVIAKGQTQGKYFLDNISTGPSAAQPPQISAQLTSQHFSSKSQRELPGSICSKLGTKINSLVQSCSFQSKFEELALKESECPDVFETCRHGPPSSEVISPEPRLSGIKSSDLESVDIRSSQIESSDFGSSNQRPDDLRPLGMGFSDDRSTDVESLEIGSADIRFSGNGTSDSMTSNNRTLDIMTSNNRTSGNSTSNNGFSDNRTSNNGFSDNRTSNRSSLKYQDLSRQKCLENCECEKQSTESTQNDTITRSTVTNLNGDCSVKVSENLEDVCQDKPLLCSNEHSTQSLMLKNERTVMVADMSNSGHVHCSLVSGAEGVSSKVAENVVVNLIEEDKVVGSAACQADVPCVAADVSAPSGTHPTAVQEEESQDLCMFVEEETSVDVVLCLGENEHQSSVIVSAEADLTRQPQHVHHELDSLSCVYDTIDGKLEKHWTPQDDPSYYEYEHIKEPEELKAIGERSIKKLVAKEVIENMGEEDEAEEAARSLCDTSKSGDKLMGDDTQCSDASVVVVSEKMIICDKADIDLTEKDSRDDHEDAPESCLTPGLESSHNMESTSGNVGVRLNITSDQGEGNTELAVEVHENDQVCDETPLVGDIRQVASFTQRAAETEGEVNQVASFTQKAAGTEGDIRQVASFTHRAAETEGDVRQVASFTQKAAGTEGDIRQVASFTHRAAETEGDVSQVASFTERAAETEGDIRQVASFTHRAAETEGDIRQVASFTHRAAETEGDVSQVASFTERAAETEGDIRQVASFTHRAAETEGDIRQVASFTHRAAETEGDVSQVASFTERAAETEGDIRQVASFTHRAAETEGDIRQVASFTHTAAETEGDMKTQQMGSNNLSINVSSQQSSTSNEISIETSRTILAADESSPPVDRRVHSPSMVPPSCVAHTPNVESSSKSEESFRPDSSKERKQDCHARTNFNSSISLAAFIAERLTKEDIEPSSAFKRNASDRASFRLIGEDSPLDICSHRMEASGVNCVGYADIISPLSSYAGVKEYMEEAYITPVNNNFSINIGHYIEGPLNVGHRELEHVASTYVMSIDSPSTHIDHSGKELIISKYVTSGGSPTHIDHGGTDLDEPAYFSPTASGPVNIDSGETESVRTVCCESLDKSCKLNVADDGKPSNAVHSSGLVDYSSSEDEEDISTGCGRHQKEPNRKHDHEEGTSRKHDSQEGTGRKHDSQEGTSRKHDSQEGTSRKHDSQEGTGRKHDSQEGTSRKHDSQEGTSRKHDSQEGTGRKHDSQEGTSRKHDHEGGTSRKHDSQEGTGRKHDHEEGTSRKHDSQEGTSRKHDSQEGTSRKHNSQEGTSRKHDSQEGTGRKHDSQEGTGRKHDSQEGTGRKHDSQEGTGRKHDSQEGTSRKHDSQEGTGRKHDSQEGTSRKHDSQEGTSTKRENREKRTNNTCDNQEKNRTECNHYKEKNRTECDHYKEKNRTECDHYKEKNRTECDHYKEKNSAKSGDHKGEGNTKCDNHTVVGNHIISSETFSESSDLQSHKSESSDLQSHKSESSDLQSHKSESSDLQSHKSESSDLQSHKSESSDLQSHKSESSDLQSHKSESSDLQSHKSESSDLQSHKSQISQVLTANLTSDPHRADGASDTRCACSATTQERALHGVRIESGLSNRPEKQGIEKATPIAAQSHNCGLLVLENNPSVNDFQSKYRTCFSCEGVAVEDLSDRHPGLVVECTRSVQEEGNSQVFSRMLGHVSNNMTEDSRQDIPLCVSPYSCQNVAVYMREEKSSKDLPVYMREEKSSKDLPVYVREEKSHEDIPIYERKENSSQDIPVCENTENRSQDIHTCLSNINCQKTVTEGGAWNNHSLASLEDTGCRVTVVSQGGSDCTPQDCYIEHNLLDSVCVDNSADDKDTYLSGGANVQCVCSVSPLDGTQQSTPASIHDGHCQLMSHSADTLVGPGGGLTPSQGIEQRERVTGQQVDSTGQGIVVESRLTVVSLSEGSHTGILTVSGRAHIGIKGDTVKETSNAQAEAPQCNKCIENVQGHVASESLPAAKEHLAEGPGICETTDCELSEDSLERSDPHVVPEKPHKKSGEDLIASSEVSEVNVGTSVCCEVFTDNIRVNSFDMQSHRRNQEKPGEHERAGAEFQAVDSDRNAHVMECGLSSSQHDDLYEEEVQLLSPVCVDSGIVIDESGAAVNIKYAAEVILSRCDAPGCEGIGSECGSSTRTSRECSLLVSSVCMEKRQASDVARGAALLQKTGSCPSHVENHQLSCCDAVRQPGSSIDNKRLLHMLSDSLCFKDSENTCFKQVSGSRVSAKGVSNQVFQKLTSNLGFEATNCEITLDTGLASVSEFKVDNGMEAKITASVKRTDVPSLVCSRSMRKWPTEDTADVDRTSVEAPLKAESDLLKDNFPISECESSLVQGSTVGRGDNQLRESSRITQSELFDAHFKQPECDIHSDTSCSTGHDSHGISNKSNVTFQNAEDLNSDAPFESRLQCIQLDNVASQGDSSADKNSSSTASRPDSPRERAGTDHEADDGDDLSDFDLIIEKDTSYRNLVSFPVTSEKRSYSSGPQHFISPYISKGKLTYLPPSATSSVLASGFTYSKIPTADGHQSLQGQQVGFTSRKPLVTAKTCRKSHRQFVWEVDDDSASGNTPRPRAAVVTPTSSLATRHKLSASEAVSDPGLDTLRRKQKALREKSETAPFTWDLDDNADGSGGSSSSMVRVRRPTKTSSDIISFEKSGHGRNVTTPANKVRQQVTPHKRPLTPDVSPGKMPAKFRRTFSVDRQVKSSGSSTGKELKRRGDMAINEVSSARSVKYPSQKFTSGSHRSTSDSQRSASDSQRSTTDSVPIDDDISFKKDSFLSPSYLTHSTDIQTSDNVLCASSHEGKGKRGERAQKQSHFPFPLDVVVQECRSESYGQVAEEDSLKNQLGLRSRHSSMDSNKSDKSVNAKRAADNNSPFPSKRSRRSEEDPSSPKLKKIGLIKITKDSLSPPAATGSDSTAPMTRSSEAAIKAFNQKSLRSRGVNPCPLAAVSSSASPKHGPQTAHPKSSPETSSRLKSSISPQKQSPQLSVTTLRHSSVETKTEFSPKSSLGKLHDGSGVAGAVIKRRLPSSPVSSSGASQAKISVSLRSRKSLAELSKHQQPMVSVSVVRVKPLPSITLTKETSKSHGTPSSKETRTLHSPLTTSTVSVKSKRDHVKQENWKISRETKLSKGKKQLR